MNEQSQAKKEQVRARHPGLRKTETGTSAGVSRAERFGLTPKQEAAISSPPSQDIVVFAAKQPAPLSQVEQQFAALKTEAKHVDAPAARNPFSLLSSLLPDPRPEGARALSILQKKEADKKQFQTRANAA